MKLRSYQDEGIILSRKTYGEADRILSLYSKSHGKVVCIAKGVRKPTSRKRGHIESFSHIRFSASVGKSMSVITETETVENFTILRTNLKKLSVAYFFLETVNKITHEGVPHEEVFDLLLKYLKSLEKETQVKELRNNFTREILVTLGYWDKEKDMPNPDQVLESILERDLSSIRIGKKLLL